ncbi:threonine synthase, partial [Campylobacter jejuni]|nr:threonine synthase [Campylobacter jejuni]
KLPERFEFGHEDMLDKAFTNYENFDAKNPPIAIKKITDKTYINELWHGPTRAFKDMALQPFGVLLNEFSQNEKILIICATSGDTGPATLKSFENLENIKVLC